MVKDLGPTLLGVTWSFTIGASTMMALRFYCRIKIVHRVWWDDLWMSFSLLFIWAMSVTFTVYAQLGATRYAPLSHARQTQTTQINWISQVWCIMSLMTSKLAIAALIARLQPPCRWRTNLLWVISIINVAWGASEAIILFAQCRPLAKVFDQSVRGKCIDAKVVASNAQACSAYWAFLDLLLAALPIQMIWKLQMPRRKKILVCCLMGAGVSAFAAAVVKTLMLRSNLDRDADFIKNSVYLFIWNSVETGIVIMAGCLPAITPLVTSFTAKRRDSTRPSDDNSDRPLRTEKPSSFRNWFDRSDLFSFGTHEDNEAQNISEINSVSDEGKRTSQRYDEAASAEGLETEHSVESKKGVIRVTKHWNVEVLSDNTNIQGNPASRGLEDLSATNV